jgi:protoporphyrinogen oxidase
VNQKAPDSGSAADGGTPATVVVIGAGPAGLTVACELSGRGVPVLVVEADSQVGGIARTVEYRGFRFDIGGHRFFTKVPAVAELWRGLLGEDFLSRPRLSRIFYRGRFFDYPLKPFNTLKNLGLADSLLILFSYLVRQLFPIRPEENFEDWVSNRFGKRLFATFFKSYTEKVWGISCRELSAQWASQRIRGLSVRTAILNMIPGAFRQRGSALKTLTERFDYPRLGPGMMWEALAERCRTQGALIELDSPVTRVVREGWRVVAVEYRQGHCGAAGGVRVAVDRAFSTMPLGQLVAALDPPAPPEVLAAASRLRYRDFLVVALFVDQAEIFPDNWIYVHDARVKVGRIQNFKNWSLELVPDPAKTCLGMEYFCFEADELWSLPDHELVALATRELGTTGLADPALVSGGAVVRMPKAYPMYDAGSLEALGVLQGYLQRFENLQPLGRNGMHKYNNMDHSVLAALLAVRNLYGEHHDLWAINSDDEYLEEQT